MAEIGLTARLNVSGTVEEFEPRRFETALARSLNISGGSLRVTNVTVGSVLVDVKLTMYLTPERTNYLLVRMSGVEIGGYQLLDAPFVSAQVNCSYHGKSSLIIIEGRGEHVSSNLEAVVQRCVDSGARSKPPPPPPAGLGSAVVLGVVFGLLLGASLVVVSILFRRQAKSRKQRKRLPTWVAVSKPFDVFISYRVASDRDRVEALYKELTAAGLRVWWDQKCLKT